MSLESIYPIDLILQLNDTKVDSSRKDFDDLLLPDDISNRLDEELGSRNSLFFEIHRLFQWSRELMKGFKKETCIEIHIKVSLALVYGTAKPLKYLGIS